MEIVFEPWVGSKYLKNQFGVKILILGESHYGDKTDEYPDFTKDVVKLWAQKNKIAFFTKITKSVLNYDTTNYLSDAERIEFWEHVSFYNYVQEIVGEGPRVRPIEDMWAKSEVALKEVIKSLDPQVLLVLGKELANNLPKLPEGIEVCYLQHPSSGGFAYSKNNYLIQKAILSISQRKGNE